MKNNFNEQAKTLDDTKAKLAKYHKDMVIRPTGFGKTWMLTELIKSYNKILYLYPAEVIKDTVVNRYCNSLYDPVQQDYIDENGRVVDPETIDTVLEMGDLKDIKDVTLMTYSKLIRLTDDDFANMDYDLILFDEAHRIGAARTSLAVHELFAANPNADFVGATATPTRMDNFDVTSVFFSDIMSYPYTLLDAIQDGLIQQPNYCFATYDFETDLKEAALTAGEDLSDPVVTDVLNARLIEMANIFNMENIIKDICSQYAKSTDYMKFISFFADQKHMKEKLDEVVSWFHKAFPNHTISVLKITSKNKEELENTGKLNQLMPQPNHIDIIACIDMLNMGYHVDNLTGIVMYRGTKSNIIFAQQVGRALSAGNNNSAIIFDVVDNLHRKAIYDMKSSIVGKKTGTKKGNNKTIETLKPSATDPTKIVVIDEQGKEHPTQYTFQNNGVIVDIHGMPSTLVYDAVNNTIIDNGTDDGKDINQLTQECLHAVGHMATLREFIAKTVAESLAQRCRYAVELHFRSWCNNHGIPYPISDKDMQQLYHLSKEDFYDYLCKVIAANNLAYPLQDAAALLEIGPNTDPTDVPLTICAARRNVSISQILDELGLAVA